MSIPSTSDNYINKFRDKLIDFLITAYYKTKNYLHFASFRKKHITLGLVNGKLQITSTDHQDFIAFVQKKIDKLNTIDTKEFIRLSLQEALCGCNFIIFSTEGESEKFIQFWTGGHTLKFNFYANKVNRLKNHFLSIIGLLSEMGFVNSTVEEYRGRMVYKVEKDTDYISVDANFRKDIDLAVECTDIIFKQIYKVDSKKLKARVE